MSLWNSTFTKPSKPMQRKTSLRATKPMGRSSRRKHKIEGHHDRKMLDACRGQSCYLLVPGVCLGASGQATVVPAHSNQQRHGKGMGIKANDQYTVPACAACHFAIDQSTRFTKQEKFAFWNAAYARWSAYRDKEAS